LKNRAVGGEEKLNWKKLKDPLWVFVMLSLVGAILLMAVTAAGHGRKVSEYFSDDQLDTGMDFINSIYYTMDRTPYTEFRTLYPPLANAFFLLVEQFMPEWVIDGWHTQTLLAVRGQAGDTRSEQAPVLMLFLFILVISLLCAMLIQRLLENRSNRESRAAGLMCLTGFAFTYAVERGNVIIMALMLSLYFLAFYRHSSAVIRETAYIALAMAAGIKIYPAFLGVLLLKERRWADAVRTVVYGLMTLILPCFLFEGGLDNLRIFFEVLFEKGHQSYVVAMGTGFKNMTSAVIYKLSGLTGRPEEDFTYLYGQVQTVSYVICFVMIISAVFARVSEWKRVLMLTMPMVCMQVAPYYTFVYMILPLVIFLRDEKELNLRNVIYFLMMIIPVMHLPLFNYYEGRKPLAIVKQGAELIIWAALIIEGALGLIHWKQTRNELKA